MMLCTVTICYQKSYLVIIDINRTYSFYQNTIKVKYHYLMFKIDLLFMTISDMQIIKYKVVTKIKLTFSITVEKMFLIQTLHLFIHCLCKTS